MAKLTRALKFEVVFPGMRTRDLWGVKDAKGTLVERGLAHDLWGAMDDLTIACTKLISAAFQVRLGTMPWPLDDKGKQRPSRTLCYQGLSGKWAPYGGNKPLYVPDRGPQVAGGCLSATADLVSTRLTHDYFDVSIGKKALSTFRKVPLLVRAAEVVLGPEDTIELLLWAGRGSRKVPLRPRKLDPRQRKLLRKLTANVPLRAALIKERLALKKAGDDAGVVRTTAEIVALGPFHGNAALAWVRPEGRKGKWMLSLSWTDAAAPEVQGGLIAGIHLGMLTAVSVAYADLGTGGVEKFKDFFNLSGTAVRAYNHTEQERRERLRFNRKEYALREGKGWQRKLRAVAAIGDKGQCTIDTAVRQLAAAVVKRCVERGASVIAIENLTHWSRDHAMDELPEGTNRQRAARRRWYFGWHQGAIREAITSAAEREGARVLSVSARNDSRECSTCGTLWEKTGVYRPKGEQPADPEYGRVTWNSFVCSCGEKLHADRNAAINTVKRGFVALKEAAAPEEETPNDVQD